MFDKSPIEGFVIVYQISSLYQSVIAEEGELSCVIQSRRDSIQGQLKIIN